MAPHQKEPWIWCHSFMSQAFAVYLSLFTNKFETQGMVVCVCVCMGFVFHDNPKTPAILVNLWVLDHPSLGVQKCDEDLMFPPEVILLNRRVRSETTWNDHLLVVGCGWLSVLDLVNHLHWLVHIGSFMHLQHLHAPLSEIPLEESQYLRWRRVRQSPCCRSSTQSQGYPDEATRAMDAEFWDVNIHGPLGYV